MKKKRTTNSLSKKKENILGEGEKEYFSTFRPHRGEKGEER